MEKRKPPKMLNNCYRLKEMPTQEAIFLLLHLPYRLSSRRIDFTNSRQPFERARLMWKDVMTESVFYAAVLELDRDAFYSKISDRSSIRPQLMQNIII